MRFHIIVNPAAGRRSAADLLASVRTHLESRGATVEIYETKSAGDAGRHVGELAADACDRLILVGGDGTLAEVVNGRTGRLPWPIGLIPRGTANLVARELNMPLSEAPRRIADALWQAEPWEVNVLEMVRGQEVTRAVANVSVGMDAEVVRAISTVRSGRSSASGGYTRWVRPILDAIRGFRFPRFSITVDGQHTYRAGACMVQGTTNYGGLFRLAPQAALDAPKLHVTMLRPASRRDLVRLVTLGMMRRIHKAKDCVILEAEHVRIEAPKTVPVQSDGDPAGETDLSVRIRRGALTLLRAPQS